MPRRTSLVNMLSHIKEEEQAYSNLTPDNQSVNAAHFLATHPDIRRRWQEDLIDLRRQENYLV
jgi:hypothetical protein